MITKDLFQSFIKNHPDDAARSLERQAPAGVATILIDLPSDVVAPALSRMDPLLSLGFMEKLPIPFEAEVISKLEINEAAALLRRMNTDARNHVLEHMTPERRRPLKLLLEFPENTVGAKMDPYYPCLPEDLSLSEALNRIKTDEDRTAMFWFTIDRGQVLTGIVSLRDLLAPNLETKVVDVRQDCPQQLSPLTNLAALGFNAELNWFNALPVVDEKKIYLGALRSEAVSGGETRAEFTESAQLAGSALGELYRLGLFGLVYSLDPGSDKTTATKGVSL